MYKLYSLFFIVFTFFACQSGESKQSESILEFPSEKIIVGAERTDEYLHLLENKKVGIVANHTSQIIDVHLVDSLLTLSVNIQAIFAPEHGFRGKADAGEIIKDGKDTKTGLPVISIYGNNKKPTADQLQGIDIMILDIQDVGARFYTYISSMHYVMEACAESSIPLIILDRPNPNGNLIDGPVLNPEYASFVGMHPVPIAHGMTIAEYAKMINGEKWLKDSLECELHLIACKNYNHNKNYSLPISPSPNLPNDRSIALYPSICLFEATSLSVGRGTDMQFQIIGHPELESVCDFSFTPVPNEGSRHPKHEGKTCFGYDLRKESDRFPTTESKLNLNYLIEIYNDFPNKSEFFIRASFFDKLAGGSLLREQLTEGKSEAEIRKSWEDDLNAYKTIRAKYLMYE